SAGTFALGFNVIDSALVATRQTLTLRVSALTITSPWGLPQAALNHAYSVQLTATSAATWKVAPNSANLPPGLSLSSGGLISGTATSLGFYGFVAIATDQITGMTATKAFGIFVNNPLAITTTTLQDGIVTEGYGQC